MVITSASNGQIKNIINLKEKSKYRKESLCFVAEGIKMFSEAPKNRLKKVYVSETFYEKNAGMLENVETQVVTDSVFMKISDTVSPQGILCVIEQKKYDLKDFVSSKDKKQRFVVLDRLQDPGNLGTIIRTAEAAGITAVIAGNDTADIYNPKVIRSTMGSVYRVPVIIADNLEEQINILKHNGIRTYAAHLHGKKNYDEIHYGDKTAVFIGNESKGISDEISAMADELVKIPMSGQAESLNAAIAAAVLMYAMR